MRQTVAALFISLGCAVPLQAAPFYTPTYGVSKTSDITYGTGSINNGAGTLNLQLDLYRPTFVSEPLPAQSPGLVFIHGGAWQSGDKNDAASFANLFASLGYVVTSINYRMLDDDVPETHGPADSIDLSLVPPGIFDLPLPQINYTINAGIEDAALAMGWMRDNAATYNIDTNHIAIGGASAGAINSLLLAYNNPTAHVAPQAVVSYVGAMPNVESLIDAGEVPAFVINGLLDPLIPIAQPQAMVDRMNLVGVYNEFYIQEGVGHDVDFDLVFEGQTLMEHNIDFLAQVLVPEPSSVVLFSLAAIALVAVGRRRLGCAARQI